MVNTLALLHFTCHDGDLFVGGRFTEAGGRPIRNLAKWNGQDWSAVPGWDTTSSTSSINQMATYRGDFDR